MVLELPYENYENYDSESAVYEGLESGIIERSDSAFITIPIARAAGDDDGEPISFEIAKPAPLPDDWYALVGEMKP